MSKWLNMKWEWLVVMMNIGNACNVVCCRLRVGTHSVWSASRNGFGKGRGLVPNAGKASLQRWRANPASIRHWYSPFEWRGPQAMAAAATVEGHHVFATMCTTRTDQTGHTPRTVHRGTALRMPAAGRSSWPCLLITLVPSLRRMTLFGTRVCLLVSVGRVGKSVGNGVLTSRPLVAFMDSLIAGHNQLCFLVVMLMIRIMESGFSTQEGWLVIK